MRKEIKRNDGIHFFKAHTSPTAISELFTYYYYSKFTTTISRSVFLSLSQSISASYAMYTAWISSVNAGRIRPS